MTIMIDLHVVDSEFHANTTLDTGRDGIARVFLTWFTGHSA